MMRLEGVTAGYADTTVLRDVTLTVPARSVVALIGPNGAGKTTLLRVASGLLRPRAGRLLLDGRDVTGHSPDQLATAGVCHVPEGRGIFPNLTVRENLNLFSPAGSAGEGIEAAVDAFPVLAERLDQQAGTMSGGQQQMVALARAYIQRAPIVLLDEVSMGLAPRIVHEIFEFLRRLAEQGSALLLVEQYVTAALNMADYVYMLGRGAVSFAGEPAELDDNTVLSQHYLGVS